MNGNEFKANFEKAKSLAKLVFSQPEPLDPNDFLKLWECHKDEMDLPEGVEDSQTGRLLFYNLILVNQFLEHVQSNSDVIQYSDNVYPMMNYNRH